MRVAISNDLKRLYGRIDYSLLQKTVLAKAYAAGSGGITVQNPAGFSANDFIVIGDPGSDTAELHQLASVSGTTLTLSSTTLTNEFSKKEPVYNIGYNQIRFYESDVLLDTVTISPDFWVEYSHAVDTTLYYHITFYNSQTTTETAAGEKIKGYNRLLCSIADIYQLESSESVGVSIMDKIEFATREILNLFITQGQDISDLNNFEILRAPCAALALKYYWMGQRKAKDDVATLKMQDYAEMYKTKITEAGAVINEQEPDVSLWGQSKIER